jgi:hypothetical protein
VCCDAGVHCQTFAVECTMRSLVPIMWTSGIQLETQLLCNHALQPCLSMTLRHQYASLIAHSMLQSPQCRQAKY